MPESVKTVETMAAPERLESPESKETAAPIPAEKPVEKEIQPPAETASAPVISADSGDLLGLANLFPPEAAGQGNVAAHLTEEEVDRIADRVIRKLSAQVVESIAWDVVPDIAVKVLRDELKKTNS